MPELANKCEDIVNLQGGGGLSCIIVAAAGLQLVHIWQTKSWILDVDAVTSGLQ